MDWVEVNEQEQISDCISSPPPSPRSGGVLKKWMGWVEEKME